MEAAYGKRPNAIYSYTPFRANDSQIIEYYKGEVPYYLIDEQQVPFDAKKVDVIGTTCPCAGLSSLSPSASSTNPANDWMIKSAEWALSFAKPKVFWGENAPRFASKMGEPVRNKLIEIAKRNGYHFSVYKTKSILHGLSQVRDRSFYFFWREDVFDGVPVFEYFNREYERIEDTITNTEYLANDPMDVLVRDDKPSDNPFYKYVLDHMTGIDHFGFQNMIPKTINPYDYLENAGHTYDKVGEWMHKHGYEKETKRCERIFKKLASGGNIMRKTTEIPKDHIGAFVGHLPTCLTHPTDDRYLTIRECLNIMKMPKDFILQGGKRNLNMICQNVPVTTAKDMAIQIKKALDGELDQIHPDGGYLMQDNKKQTYELINATPASLDNWL